MGWFLRSPFIPMIYMFILMSVPYILGHYNFAIGMKSGCVSMLTLYFCHKIVLCVLAWFNFAHISSHLRNIILWQFCGRCHACIIYPGFIEIFKECSISALVKLWLIDHFASRWQTKISHSLNDKTQSSSHSIKIFLYHIISYHLYVTSNFGVLSLNLITKLYCSLK